MNPDRIPYLLGAIFGVRDDSQWPPPAPHPSIALSLIEATNAVLLSLSPREEKVIKMLFGLSNGDRSHTQKEVASHFSISVYRLRQIEAKALRKLRHPSRSRLLSVFLDETRTWTGTQPQYPTELIPTI